MTSRSSALLAALSLLACGSQELAAAPREARLAPASAPPLGPAPTPASVPIRAPGAAPAPLAEPAPVPVPSNPIVARARLEVARAVTYDPAWVAIGYPGGDPAPDRGVCTDVVIRAVRAAGVDLQRTIHEDILARPAVYTTVKRPDRSIDHRRVTPMLTYLRAHATSLPTTFDGAAVGTWEAGDIVVWSFAPCPSCTPDHVGIVSDHKGPRGIPLVLHNIGPRPSEDDHLDAWTVLGHFRLRGASAPERIEGARSSADP
ncbi:DUF1287 domain-containing protein [Sorangium sp. So ce388]|uniref:DUF1287 domain-containing protein n=1 Tax=Sorangium sp. So ce388 TaxID=3133309 RepID=UPI003F5C2075